VWGKEAEFALRQWIATENPTNVGKCIAKSAIFRAYPKNPTPVGKSVDFDQPTNLQTQKPH